LPVSIHNARDQREERRRVVLRVERDGSERKRGRATGEGKRPLTRQRYLRERERKGSEREREREREREKERVSRYRTEDGSSARCHVDQPRTQIKRKGNSGDGLHNTQAQV
jgi:hypothetical protein